MIFILSLFLLSSCGTKKSAPVPGGLLDTLNAMSASINSKDIKGFLKYIDSENKEFFAEEKHWFEDIMGLDIKNFSMEISSISQKDDGLLKVEMSQYGQLGESSFLIKCTGVFTKYGSLYKFSDLYFESMETEHFIIKYSPSLKKQAADFSVFIDDAYDWVKSIYGHVPEDKTVIKLYDNSEVFNWFIKPSISFDMAGWYEYPESIKINMSSMRNMHKDELRSRFEDVIAHELTHRTNMIESNNNIPYWMAEGIATYVQYGGEISREKPEMGLMALEKINLEQLRDPHEISNYYSSSYIYISRFIDKYGIGKLQSLLAGLKKYPVQEKTGGQSIEESNRIFHEVLGECLSISFWQLDKELAAYE